MALPECIQLSLTKCFVALASERAGCETNTDCTSPEICCPVKKVCELPLPTDPTACGDPHMTGFHGQKFDFTGDDGEWYCLISDLPSMNLNMRVTAPVPSRPDITYITGISLITQDGNGLDHSVVITVKDPHSLESSCPAGVTPCLANGALSVSLDGKEALSAPGVVEMAPNMKVSVVNLPGACRSFGFEKYWERKKLEYAQAGGRRLSSKDQDMGDWILGDPTATNMAECTEYVARHVVEGGDGGLFAHKSEHASFQIVMPIATVRLSHGRLHQIAQYGLPDHSTWQMNLAIDSDSVGVGAQGVLGETLVPTRDADGEYVMHGMESIRGTQEECELAHNGIVRRWMGSGNIEAPQARRFVEVSDLYEYERRRGQSTCQVQNNDVLFKSLSHA
ncbi:unnamed protein product [Ectocarpus sp. CCAP 1310/34]|nr:unnamed protein product [Ectocarpus sp. CCAP 1310/34]